MGIGFQDHFELKCHFHFLNNWVLLKSPKYKLKKIGKNPIFQTLNPFFFLFGGVVTKNAFSKMFLTFRYSFFDTNLILWQHPQQVFYDLKNQFLKIFGKKNIFFIFWMFLHHPSKFGEFSLKIGGEIICQSWALFTPFFNFPIVHWWLLIVWWE